MELLTQDEYRAIASGLTLPTAAYIDGAYRPAASGKTFKSINPANGEVLAESQPAVKAMSISRSARHARPLTMAAGRACIRRTVRTC